MGLRYGLEHRPIDVDISLPAVLSKQIVQPLWHVSNINSVLVAKADRERVTLGDQNAVGGNRFLKHWVCFNALLNRPVVEKTRPTHRPIGKAVQVWPIVVVDDEVGGAVGVGACLPQFG